MSQEASAACVFRWGVEVGVRYLIGTCLSITYLITNPLYIAVFAILR